MKSFMRNDFLQKAKKKYENSNLCFEGAKDKDGKLWWHFALVDVELSVDDVKPEEFKRFLENYLDQTPPICKLCAEIIDYSNKIVAYVLDTNEDYKKAYRHLSKKYNNMKENYD